MDKAPEAFRTISEVADDLDVPQHVLRFWETRFPQVRPLKRGGGRRYYRPEDVDLLRGIRHLLYGKGYTIRGVQRLFKEQGSRFVAGCWRPGAPALPLAEIGQAVSAARLEAGPERDEALRHLFGTATRAVDVTLEMGRGGGDMGFVPSPSGSAEMPTDSGGAVFTGAAEPIEALRTAAAADALETKPVGDGGAASRLSDGTIRSLRAMLSDLQDIKRILDGA